MQKVRIEYDQTFRCPFCGKVILGYEDEMEICEHTLFVGCTEGFHYIRDDVNLETEYEDWEAAENAIDSLEIKNSFALVLQPTFVMGGTDTYVGFQPKLD